MKIFRVLQLKVTEYVLDENDQLMPMNRLHGENTVGAMNVKSFAVRVSSLALFCHLALFKGNRSTYRNTICLCDLDWNDSVETEVCNT